MRHLNPLSFFFLLVLILYGNTAIAQNQFSGTISYNCSYLGESAEMLDGFLVERYTYEINGCDLIFRMEGGLMGSVMGPILVQGNSNKSYMLDEITSIAYLFDRDEEGLEETSDENKPVLIESNVSVLGYMTDKYEKIVVTDTGEITYTYYMSKEVELNWTCGNRKTKVAVDNPISTGLSGLPVKMITIMGDLTIIMELGELEEVKFEKGHFSIPKDYTVEPFNNWMDSDW